MKTKVAWFGATLALMTGFSGAIAPVAEATTPNIYLTGLSSVIHAPAPDHGITQAAIVQPHPHVRRGVHDQLIGFTTGAVRIAAFAHGRRVDSGANFHAILLPGNYRLATQVRYRRYKLVGRVRIASVHRASGYPGHSRCVVTRAENYGPPASYDFIDNANCTNPLYPGQIARDTDTVTSATGPYAIGQVVYSPYVYFHSQYVKVSQPYLARQFTSSAITKTFITYLTIVEGRPKPAPISHVCTRTSSGSCIRGGEFCPQASYGKVGYDTHGGKWVCEGSRTHPHWE